MSADLWHLRLRRLCVFKLKTRATSVTFAGEPCFCQTCVMAKMKCAPFLKELGWGFGCSEAKHMLQRFWSFSCFTSGWTCVFIKRNLQSYWEEVESWWQVQVGCSLILQHLIIRLNNTALCWQGLWKRWHLIREVRSLLMIFNIGFGYREFST